MSMGSQGFLKFPLYYLIWISLDSQGFSKIPRNCRGIMEIHGFFISSSILIPEVSHFDELFMSFGSIVLQVCVIFCSM